jgi:mannonate dehydratase
VRIQEQLTIDQVTPEMLNFYRAISVDDLIIRAPLEAWDDGAQVDRWQAMQDLAGKHGLFVNALATRLWDEILLGKPERDRRIDSWCAILETLGGAGVPVAGYDFFPRFFRTESEPPGRGGARYSTFDYGKLGDDAPDVAPPVLTEAAMWENLWYFLERTIPVAEEHGVKMALHPDDPPIPEPLGGIPRIVSSLDHYRRIFGRVPSDANAMIFCQGCVAEMGTDVCAAIREMGGQGRIAYVHFRNIRGNPPHRFQEVFVDEGDQDMLRAMQAYKEAGFNGPYMMDHTPQFPNREDSFRAGKAYAIGYIRAMIQAVYR